MKLTDDLVILAEEGTARASAFCGAFVPVVNPDMGAIPWAAVAGVAGDLGRLVAEGDRLLVGARVVDGDRGRRVVTTAIPAGPGHVPVRIRGVVEQDKVEVAATVVGQL